MAKVKKEDVQEEILEQEVQEATCTDPFAELKAKALAKTEKLQKERENMIKLYCKSDTPFLKEPNLNTNISGVIQKGTMLYATEIIDNGDNGKFYKINDQKYVNTQWDFEVF